MRAGDGGRALALPLAAGTSLLQLRMELIGKTSGGRC
jgi:hypothetical protein